MFIDISVIDFWYQNKINVLKNLLESKFYCFWLHDLLCVEVQPIYRATWTNYCSMFVLFVWANSPIALSWIWSLRFQLSHINYQLSTLIYCTLINKSKFCIVSIRFRNLIYTCISHKALISSFLIWSPINSTMVLIFSQYWLWSMLPWNPIGLLTLQ